MAPIASAQPGWDDEGVGDSDGASEASAPSDSGSSGSDAEDDFSDPTAGAGGAPSSSDADADFGEVSEEEIDAKLEQLGGYLKDIQAPLRAHSAGWILTLGGIAGFSVWQATDTHGAVKASAIIRATTSGANLLLTMFSPSPGRSAWRKYKKMPEGTLEEKRAKLDAGRRWLSGQVSVDKLAAHPARHVFIGLLALACGAGVLFSYDEGMRPAVETTIGILLIGELQIATRPRRTRRYNMEFATGERGGADLAFAPIVTSTARGLGLVGRF